MACTLLCVYAVSFSLVHVISICLLQTHRSFLEALRQAPLSFFVALFCILLLVPVGCLTTYHCFLIMRGVTTHEQVNKPKTLYMKHEKKNNVNFIIIIISLNPMWERCLLKQICLVMVIRYLIWFISCVDHIQKGKQLTKG
jgi:hypothetical protein